MSIIRGKFMMQVLTPGLFLCGAVMFAYGRLASPLVKSELAVHGGNLELALQYCSAGEARFNRIPFAKQVFRSNYEKIVSSQLWLLYNLEQYDATIEKASNAPAGSLPHFWLGCALFQKARDEEKPEAARVWLRRSEEEFRKALEFSPDDWDSKFNYELTRRLMQDSEKQRERNQNQIMRLLRPKPKEGQRTFKKTG